MAATLSNLALLFHAQGRLADAVSLLQRALEIDEKAHGAEHPGNATTLNNLAVLYVDLARHAEAESLYQRSLKIKEKLHGPEHPSVATSLNNLAVFYKQQGLYDKAEPLYQRTLKIRKEVLGPEHPIVAESLSNLANLYRDQGRYADAEALLLRSLEIQKRVLGLNHPGVAITLNGLAELHCECGRYAEAELLHQQSLKIREKVLGPDHEQVATSLSNLAGLYGTQGRYAEAEPLYQRSLRIKEKLYGPEHPSVALILNNIGSLYTKQHRFDEAESRFRRSLDIYENVHGPEHPVVETILNNLAELCRRQGRYAEAEPLYQRSLRIKEKLHGPEHPSVAVTLNNMGLLYSEQGRLEDAELLHQRSLRIKEAVHGPEHPSVATSLSNLAGLYRDQGRYAEVEPLIDRAIAIRETNNAAPVDRFRVFNIRSDLRWQTGQAGDAVADLSMALDLAEQQRGRFGGTSQQRAEASEQFGTAYEKMITWQRTLGNVPAAFAAAERGRARGLIEEIAAAGVDFLAGVPHDDAQRLRQREGEAQTRAASLERQLELLDAQRDLNEAAGEQQRRQLLAELSSARQAVVDAYAAIRNASPAYRQAVGRDFRPLTLDEVQRELAGDGNLVLEYVLGEKAGYLFVIPPDGQTVRIDTLEVSDEQAAALGVEPGPLTADRMREILTNEERSGTLDLLREPNSSDTAIDKLAALWQLLIPEAERDRLAAGEYDRLVLLPDGALTMLPFEALVVEHADAPVYLLDVGPPIEYGPSATVLVNLKNSDRTSQITDRKPVLTVGDPRYGDTSQMASADSALDDLAARGRYRSAGGTLKALPYTGVESRWLIEVFGKQGIATGQLIGADATEAKVRFNVAGRKVVHLACHGLADQQHGNFFGALALAPGAVRSGSTDDGYLTLPEIYELDLAGCELAILSACETNVGPQQRGEGVWALSRGFLVAGSRRVVASNWLVDDEGAASLISVFAGHVARGESGEEPLDHAAGLHEAKKWVRRQSKWQAPYYWATFVLVGPS